MEKGGTVQAAGRNRFLVALACLAFLASCGTPQEQCIARETRDLRNLDRLIAETGQNIERGYAIEEFRTVEYVQTICQVPAGRRPDGSYSGFQTVICTRPETVIDTRPVAINLNAERAKLESMRVKRRELARRAEVATAQCRTLHPE